VNKLIRQSMQLTGALFLCAPMAACTSAIGTAHPGLATQPESAAEREVTGEQETKATPAETPVPASSAAPASDSSPGEASEDKPASTRRAVPQRHLPGVPLSQVPATPPIPPAAPSSVRQPETAKSRPTAPVPLTNCDAGGCWSGGTERYQGPGPGYLDRSGRLCQRQGGWMQCF